MSNPRVFGERDLKELKRLWKTGEYTKTILAEMFGCSVTTVCLWLNPNEDVRKKKFKSRYNNPNCHCGVPFVSHLRCSICTKLLHGNESCYCQDNYSYFIDPLMENPIKPVQPEMTSRKSVVCPVDPAEASLCDSCQ